MIQRACCRCGRPFVARTRRHRYCEACEPRGREDASPSTRAQTPEYYRNRQIVLRRDAGKPCPECGKSIAPGDATVDHIVSVARGGSNDIRNLQVMHSWCNRSKGARISGGHQQARPPAPPAGEQPSPRPLRLPGRRDGGGS